MRRAASSTAGPWRRPGDRVRRSMGPLTLTAATTRSAGSTTGALTEATPGWRSATLSTQPVPARPGPGPAQDAAARAPVQR